MHTFVNRFHAKDEYYYHEGCFIIECSNSPDDPAVSIARARVEAGQTTRWHRLKDTTERYLIQSGQGIAETQDHTPVKLHPGDILVIPAGHAQRIHNPGPEDLIFLAICSPRFDAGNYEDVEGLV